MPSPRERGMGRGLRRGMGRGKNRQRKTLDSVEVSLMITELASAGDGLADYEGDRIYVPMTVPGDRVNVALERTSKGYRYLNTVAIEEKSPERATPACSHFGKCGGCKFQMMPDALYRKWMQDRVVGTLAQHGVTPAVINEPIISPPASRRRLAMKAVLTGSGVLLGFAERQSHQLVDVGQECPIARPELVALFEPLRRLTGRLIPMGQMLHLHLTLADNGVDLLLEGPVDESLDVRERLAEFADTHDMAALRVERDGFLDPISVRRIPAVKLGGVNVEIPPAAFLQATSEGQDVLIELVNQGLTGAKKIADLFSGIGTFTFPLARTAQVLSVEGSRLALDTLRSSADRARITRIKPLHRDLFRSPIRADELAGFDGLVFDPPRAGAEAQAAEIAKSEVPVVMAVSCNPTTFARDAALLCGGGYKLSQISLVDQFLWSSHIELVAKFERC